MKWLKRLGLVFLLGYLAIIALAFFAQRSLLYFPPTRYLTPEAVGMSSMQELEIVPSTTSWWAAPADDTKSVVIFFHGNGSAVFSNYDIFKDLMAQGHGVLSVGYPGYPHKAMPMKKRGAKPTQPRLVQAAELNYLYVLDQNIAPERIVFFGTSLGSGVAAQLAATHHPRLLILDAPFNSTLDMGKKQMPFLPVELLMKDKFESDKAIAGLDVPLIWTHGTHDQVVPISQGQKLFDNYNGPKTAHIIKGGRHTNLWAMGARDIVLEELSPTQVLQP